MNAVTDATFNNVNLYRDGEVVRQIVGAKPKAAILQDLAAFL